MACPMSGSQARTDPVTWRGDPLTDFHTSMLPLDPVGVGAAAGLGVTWALAGETVAPSSATTTAAARRFIAVIAPTPPRATPPASGRRTAARRARRASGHRRTRPRLEPCCG